MVGALLIYAKRGAFPAVTTFLIVFIASMAAINYYHLLEYLLVWAWSGMSDYADTLGLLISFLLVFVPLQYCAITFVEEHTQMNPVANALSGAVFGTMAGMLLVGLLAISWLMLPGSAYFLGDNPKGAQVVFNADQMLLTTARFIANDRIQGSAPFDPMRNFMKLYTNKYRGVEGIPVESSPGRRSRRVGMADDVDLQRSDQEPQ